MNSGKTEGGLVIAGLQFPKLFCPLSRRHAESHSHCFCKQKFAKVKIFSVLSTPFWNLFKFLSNSKMSSSSSSWISREEFEDFKNEVNSRFEQVRAEFVDLKREQIDLARQNNKVCIVLSGNSVRYQKNAKSAFIGIAWKAFGVRVGIFDLQIVHYLDRKSENSSWKLIGKFKKTGPNSAFW